MADKRFDIFGALRNIDKRNIGYFNGLSEDERKQFSPVMAMQWMFCLKDPKSNPLQLILLNEFVNPYIFSLYKHPELLYYLMCAAAPGTQQQYKWTKSAPAASKYPKSVEVVKASYGYSTRQAVDALPVLTNDDIMELASDIGLDVDAIKKLKLELKKRV